MISVEPRSIADRFGWLVDWLYPPRCRACSDSIHGEDAAYFCASCRGHIELVLHPLCSVCGQPYPDAAGDDHVCALCLSRPPHFIQAQAWACYPREESTEHPLRRVIQRFKYGRKVSLGRPLGQLLGRGCHEFLSSCPVDLIIPVPLHPKRLRWRGFNQSVLLARQVCRLYNVPMDALLLYRNRETPPQTQLSEDERRRNMRGAFSLNPHKSVKNQRILLVDDVYTSGATVNECSRMLKKGGAAAVYVVTLARAVY